MPFQVVGLRKTTSPSTKWFVSTSPPPEGNPIPPYDHIILAAPFQSSLITLLGSSAKFEPPVDYIHLHVTLLTTTVARPNPVYFGLRSGASLPSMILTTHDAGRRDPTAAEPEFNSLSYHGLTRPKDHPLGPEWVVKIFSKATITDEWLEKVFGKGNVGWVYRKEVRLDHCMRIRQLCSFVPLLSRCMRVQWDSYPKGVPTSSFPPINPDEGLWYINSLEP
jgi:prenylcysteine oxidase / farnesylcysteine lyase